MTDDARVQAIRALWMEYATHNPACEIRRNRACDCGFEQAVLQIQEHLTAVEAGITSRYELGSSTGEITLAAMRRFDYKKEEPTIQDEFTQHAEADLRRAEDGS